MANINNNKSIILEVFNNMAKAFSYKKSTSINLKACGMVDIARGVIEIDGEEKSILELLKDFDGLVTELGAKVKDEQDLELGESDESEE